MNQEHYPDWYVTFRKWQFRVTYCVLIPLLVVYGLLLTLSNDGSNTFTGKQGWHPLMQALAWGCFIILMSTFIVFGIISLKMRKKQQ